MTNSVGRRIGIQCSLQSNLPIPPLYCSAHEPKSWEVRLYSNSIFELRTQNFTIICVIVNNLVELRQVLELEAFIFCSEYHHLYWHLAFTRFHIILHYFTDLKLSWNTSVLIILWNNKLTETYVKSICYYDYIFESLECTLPTSFKIYFLTIYTCVQLIYGFESISFRFLF